jgi:hypothetical protein
MSAIHCTRLRTGAGSAHGECGYGLRGFLPVPHLEINRENFRVPALMFST